MVISEIVVVVVDVVGGGGVIVVVVVVVVPCIPQCHKFVADILLWHVPTIMQAKSRGCRSEDWYENIRCFHQLGVTNVDAL